MRIYVREASRTLKMKTFWASLLTLAMCASGYAQTLDKAKLDRFFDRLAEENKAMGSLTIAKDGNVLYSRAIGYSQIDGSEGKRSTSATRYRIASVTKMFTATMILQLSEEGELKLTDTLESFFPRIPNAEKITISQMLAHRSGIHDFTEDRGYTSWKTEPKTPGEMVALIAQSKPEFDPGEKTKYSNSNFVLLGFIAEKVGGEPYQQALEDRITSRIGIKNTYLGTGKTDAAKNESFSYKYGRTWERQPETHLSIASGAGALISTPADLATFIQALFDLKLISQNSLNQMMQNDFGMNTFPYNGKTLYGHTGGMDNFGSWLVYLPEEKLAVAYTSNAKVYPVADIVDGVFDIYWNRLFQIPTFETVAISAEVLDKYVGVYSSPAAPVKFTVTRDNATLFVQRTGQSAVPLEATAQDRFKIDPPGIVIEFDAAKNQMIIKRSRGQKVFTKEE